MTIDDISQMVDIISRQGTNKQTGQKNEFNPFTQRYQDSSKVANIKNIKIYKKNNN